MEKLDADAVTQMQGMLGMDAPAFRAGEKTAFEMAAALRMMDGLVTSRYHAAVLSMESRIPLVAVSMDERLDGLLEETGISRYRIGVSELRSNGLYKKMINWDAETEEIQQLLKEETETGKQTLVEMSRFLKMWLENRPA